MTARPHLLRAGLAAGGIAFTVLWMLDRVIAGVVQCPAAGSCPW